MLQLLDHDIEISTKSYRPVQSKGENQQQTQTADNASSRSLGNKPTQHWWMVSNALTNGIFHLLSVPPPSPVKGQITIPPFFTVSTFEKIFQQPQ